MSEKKPRKFAVFPGNVIAECLGCRGDVDNQGVHVIENGMYNGYSWCIRCWKLVCDGIDSAAR